MANASAAPEEKAKAQAARRQWARENRDKIRGYARDYYHRNKDLIRQRLDAKVVPAGKPDTAACRQCGVEKPFDAQHFAERRDNKWLLNYTCRTCVNEQMLARSVARTYGITLAQAREMRSKACEICGSREDLHIDHCHTRGHVRGVLCSGCNRGIGCFGDDPDRLRAAARYCEER